MTIQVLQINQTELTEMINDAVKLALNNQQSTVKQKQLITLKEYCKLRNVNKSTLWRWEQNGTLIPIRLGSKIFYEV